MDETKKDLKVTTEQLIQKRISLTKKSWESLKNLANECRSNNIFYLDNFMTDIKSACEKEMFQLRIDLCKDRDE